MVLYKLVRFNECFLVVVRLLWIVDMRFVVVIVFV